MEGSLKSRGFTFTIFGNLGELVPQALRFFDAQKTLVYGIYGKEVCPTTKRDHLQCYIYYQNPRTWKEIKKYFPNAHIEIAKGTPEENKAYCSKEKSFEEFGELPHQGKRSDLDQMRSLVQTGASLAECWSQARSFQAFRMAAAGITLQNPPIQYVSNRQETFKILYDSGPIALAAATGGNQSNHKWKVHIPIKSKYRRATFVDGMASNQYQGLIQLFTFSSAATLASNVGFSLSTVLNFIDP